MPEGTFDFTVKVLCGGQREDLELLKA